MKLQLEGQNLRIRIGEEELARLLGGQAIEVVTQCADVFAVRCSLALTSVDAASLSGSPADWRVALPEAEVRRHASVLPTRDGLHFVLPGAREEDNLQLLFDVDVRDSVRQRRKPG
jgi:hypothetical protein